MHSPISRLAATSVVTVTLLLCSADPQGQTAGQTTSADVARPSLEPWRSFEATASASGRRETLAVEPGRTAMTLRLSGSLFIIRSDDLGKGFRADFIGFDDGGGTGAARAVWTDNNGDRIFSRMAGTGAQTGRRSTATITGGTGRYAGITGTYMFTWQYLMPGEQDVIQVRVVAMKGRYRLEPTP